MVREQIATDGPVPYADVIGLALYHPDHGFYSSGGRAGRRGDFITSPEVGPLFGHVIANALDDEWDRLGNPETFSFIDYGAGPGTLARSIREAAPRCWPALRYVAIERSIEQRALHPDWVTSVGEFDAALIGQGIVGVVLANELLDNLAFTPLVRVGSELVQLDVSVTADGDLISVPGRLCDQPGLFEGGIDAAVLQTEASAWLSRMRDSVTRGRIVVLDYARLSSERVEVRTYAGHGRAGDPLEALGTKDITVDVDLAQLQASAGVATTISTQAHWLGAHGLMELVADGRRSWAEGAAVGDLAALKARSRIREAEALVEMTGLGGFTVAEWVVG
ncbi:MAG: SAM-dependent MidA family methyltransferase [Verrucomicrobiales bacterium]